MNAVEEEKKEAKVEEKKKHFIFVPKNRTPNLMHCRSTVHLKMKTLLLVSPCFFTTVDKNTKSVSGNRFKSFSDFVFLVYSFSLVLGFKTNNQTQCYSDKTYFPVLKTEKLFLK
jgi:hypothetical protein